MLKARPLFFPFSKISHLEKRWDATILKNSKIVATFNSNLQYRKEIYYQTLESYVLPNYFVSSVFFIWKMGVVVPINPIS